MRTTRPALACGLVTLALGGCATTTGGVPAREEPEPARLVGEATRLEIEAVRPEWVEETILAEPDSTVAEALLEVEPAELTIFLGTWCSDSRRELSRLWRALDDLPGAPPLEIRYIAVERDKREPRELVGDVDLRYVPTFVVAREGREIGRVIEEAPGGIEGDLLALLTGRASGWITARDDLGTDGGQGR